MNGRIDVFGPPAGPLRVVIGGTLELPASAALEREWSRRCAGNPSLHDGPVLHVDRFHPATGEIACLRTSYKVFVAGHVAGIRVVSLGITGIVERIGAAGIEVLLGRRGDTVRIYAGLWETAPRGAVEAGVAARALGLTELASCLNTEAREEVGIKLRVGRCVGFVRDPVASSLDVCLRCEPEGDAGGGNWEYQQRAWVPVTEVGRWARGSAPADFAGQSLSPPCAAWFAEIA